MLDSATVLLLERHLLGQDFLIVALNLPLILLKTLKVNLKQRRDLIDDEFDLFLTEFD